MNMDIQKLKDDMAKMIAECNKRVVRYIKNNEFKDAFECKNALEALVDASIAIEDCKTEKEVLKALELNLKSYNGELKIYKKQNQAMYCLVLSDKIREVEDNVLNEIRMGTYDT